ncbi:hypothetical protein ACHAXT_001369 [Thalassiosira profunda]
MASSEGGREIEAAKKRLAAAEARASADATAVQVAKAAEASAREMAETAKQSAVLAQKNAEASEKNAAAAAKNREGVEAQAEASTEEVQDAQKSLKEAEERWKVIPINDDSEPESENENKKRFCDSDGGFYRWGTYDGELNEDGLRHGKGKMTYDDDGEWYDGNWENGKREGQGTCRDADGDVYEGHWKNGLQEGKGKTTYADGDVHEGNYKDGNWNGRGTYYWKNGEVEVGKYKDDEPIGEWVRWSKDRQTAWLSKDGEKTRKISLKKAKEMAAQLGFDGVPPPNGPTTTTPSTNNTNNGGPTRVTVSVTKPSKDTKLGLGIGIKKGATCICVESIPEKSLFSNTDLEVGMAIETVNGESYDTFQECLALLKGAEGGLTLVAVAQAASPLPPA